MVPVFLLHVGRARPFLVDAHDKRLWCFNLLLYHVRSCTSRALHDPARTATRSRYLVIFFVAISVSRKDYLETPGCRPSNLDLLFYSSSLSEDALWAYDSISALAGK